ncbi:MAG: radical SAM protein [Paludibacteraceae bacterium]
MATVIQKYYDLIACDITSNCNLRCPFCLNDFRQISGNNFMTRETFEKILPLFNLVKDEGFFYFSCLFEPTIHPDFVGLLNLIPNEQRKKVFFTTNLAKKLPDDTLYQLSQSNIHHINISLDSLKPEVFESMRRGAKMEVFLDNLARIVDIFARNPHSPKLRYITILCKSNINEAVELLRTTSDKYRSSEHEFRCFHPNEEFQDVAWVKRNLITLKDWEYVKKILLGSKYHYCLGGYVSGDNYAIPSNNDYERTIYQPPPDLALRISSDGEIELLDMPGKIRFNIADNFDYYSFLPKIIPLHSLAIERGRELQRVVKSEKFFQLKTYRMAARVFYFSYNAIAKLKRRIKNTN